MRRFAQQTGDGECKRILKEEKRGTFSVIGDGGYPYSVPVNFYYDEEDNRIYIHTSGEGHKADSLRNNDKVCFTVWDGGYKDEGHWEWNVTSVVVFGRARFVSDRELMLDRLQKLAVKYYPTNDEVLSGMNSSAVARVQMIEIDIEHMTGKRVNEK